MSVSDYVIEKYKLFVLTILARNGVAEVGKCQKKFWHDATYEYPNEVLHDKREERIKTLADAFQEEMHIVNLDPNILLLEAYGEGPMPVLHYAFKRDLDVATVTLKHDMGFKEVKVVRSK